MFLSRQFQIGFLQATFEIQSAAASGFRAAVKVVEEGEQLIEITLRDRIVFVVVADGTFQGESHERGPNGADAVDHVPREALFGQRRATVDDQMQPIETRRDQLIGRRRRIEIACDLRDRELVVGQVVIERADHPVTIRSHLAIMVVVQPVGIRKSNQVHPVTRHVLAIVRRVQQRIDQAAVGVGTLIGDERSNLFDRRRQTGQVKREPSDQGPAVGCFGWHQSAGSQRRIDEPVDGGL